MSSTDDDILDFDFFDEGATSETQSREPRGADRRSLRGGGPRRPVFRAPGGLTPLVRLIGLIAFAIIIVVLVVLWAQGCSSNHQRGKYSRYLGDVGTVGSDSAKIGGQLSELITTPGLKQADLLAQLGGLIQQAEQDVSRAQRLDPPGPVRAEHEHAVEALQFRVSGLQGLVNAFQATATSRDAVQAGRLLSGQAERLLASDVVWSDLFRAPAVNELQRRSVSGVAVPASSFVTNSELYAAKSLTLVWQRVHGASTGGTPSGLHGTNVAFVKVVPSGQQLGSSETTIKSSTELGFEVGVHDGGSSQEVQIQVTLTIPAQPSPIVKTATIDVIDPGETKTVTFKDFPNIPIGDKTSVKVEVKPVKGEANTGNNTAEFPIIVSL